MRIEIIDAGESITLKTIGFKNNNHGSESQNWRAEHSLLSKGEREAIHSRRNEGDQKKVSKYETILKHAEEIESIQVEEKVPVWKWHVM